MVGKLFEMWKDAHWVDKACSHLPGKKKRYVKDLPRFRRTFGMRHNKPLLPKKIDKQVDSELEDFLLSYGDDGLLEFHSAFKCVREPQGRPKDGYC